MTKKLVVVSAPWCQSCTLLKDQLTRNNITYSVKDVDEEMEYCQENGVRSLPTSFIYDGNEIVKVVVGNKYQEIKEALE